ncbi:MAG: RHS repeat protein [Deltaproteobacteria bacterium]|nr:RHS repeat protein [Deltaproteobacteria bacterium]
MQDASGTHDYTYYADSALHTAGPWDNDGITYTYDKLGRITGIAPQSGQALSYTYDDLNRLTNIQAGANNFAYGYTGADPLVQTLTRPGGAQTLYQYNDPLKRLTALINNDASSQLINRFDYAYSDAAHPDQRSSETVITGPSFTFPQNELTQYEHNSLNQLIRATAPEKLFTYDDAGNMTLWYT